MFKKFREFWKGDEAGKDASDKKSPAKDTAKTSPPNRPASLRGPSEAELDEVIAFIEKNSRPGHGPHSHGPAGKGALDAISAEFNACSFCGRTPEQILADAAEKIRAEAEAAGQKSGTHHFNLTLAKSLDGKSIICSDCVEEMYASQAAQREMDEAQDDIANLAQGLPVRDRGAASRFGKSAAPVVRPETVIPKPSDIKAQLDGYVLGQESLKRRLSVAVVNHYERIAQLEDKKELNANEARLGKANVLVMGPTGTGKTLAAETIARQLDVPFAKWDATTLTSEGFVGKKPHDILAALLANAGGDVKRAQRGIVFIDEIDKIARNGGAGGAGGTSYGGLDVGGAGAQQSLLKLLEGSVVDVPDFQKQKMIKVDTTNILFITAGAFTQLKDIILERKKKENASPMGFTQAVRNKPLTADDIDIGEATESDLANAGLLPELIGRLQIRTHTNALSTDDLKRILTEPKDALVKQYQTLFRNKKQGHAALEFSEDALQAIAERAAASGTGGRGLRSILEDVLLDAMYDVPGMPGVQRVLVTKDTVTKHEPPQYIMAPPPAPAPVQTLH